MPDAVFLARLPRLSAVPRAAFALVLCLAKSLVPPFPKEHARYILHNYLRLSKTPAQKLTIASRIDRLRRGLNMALELPQALVDAVREERAVLFLGAGSSRNALHPKNVQMPDGEGLRDFLCDSFFGGKLKTRSLAAVTDYAINERDLLTVQEVVAGFFREFEPADFHKLIPTFRWRALVTTNLDLIVEKAYKGTPNSHQELVIFLKNNQHFDIEMKKRVDPIPFLKLHGCIDHPNDIEIPLVLSNEQLLQWKQNRDRLFHYFADLGYEHYLIFCGYAFNDFHIRTILFDLTDPKINRPQYALVDPSLAEVESRYWNKNRVTPLKATFAEFMHALNGAIPAIARAIPRRLAGGTTSLSFFYRVSNPPESVSLKEFLGQDARHIRSGMPVEAQDPKAFYRGSDNGWGGISQDLDARRNITDSILADAILASEEERTSKVDLFLISGPAGNGKTISLKRVAWEAALRYGQLVLFLEEGGSVRAEALEEIYRLTNRRIFLLIDHVALFVPELVETIERCKRIGVLLTVLVTERDNEWNTRCQALDRYLASEFPVRYLSEREIRDLLEKLEKHGALGELRFRPLSERVEAFLNSAERQLLVALHDLTLGEPFERIVRDEFQRIVPEEAKVLYLDICTLNRLGVPVRAGLISRVSGIVFKDFRERFFLPLEHIVQTREDRYIGDFTYSARHPHVAEIVFSQALEDPELRFSQVVRMLNGMNISYSSDEFAFRVLTRGRTVTNTFKSQELGRKLYEIAQELIGPDGYLMQQRGIFEMTHAGGSLDLAERYLDQAGELKPKDRTILHSQAELLRRKAASSADSLERAKLRQRASEKLAPLLDPFGDDPHGFHTKALLEIDSLRDVLAQIAESGVDKAREQVFLRIVREVEQSIAEGLQLFPDNERLLGAEAEFRDLIDQSNRAEEALKKAFAINPRQDWIAVRLARKLASKDLPAARKILNQCLDANPGSKWVHFELAKSYLYSTDPAERSLRKDHFRRSFSEGDSNFDAQFWFARELFLSGEYPEARKLFEHLKEAPISPTIKRRIRGVLMDTDGKRMRFSGTVVKREDTYCLVRSSAFPEQLLLHISNFVDDWQRLSLGSDLEISVGFTMTGVQASEARFRSVS